MSNYPLGAENHPNAPYNETDNHECPVCGAEVETQGMTCSTMCHKTMMI